MAAAGKRRPARVEEETKRNRNWWWPESPVRYLEECGRTKQRRRRKTAASVGVTHRHPAAAATSCIAIASPFRARRDVIRVCVRIAVCLMSVGRENWFSSNVPVFYVSLFFLTN